MKYIITERQYKFLKEQKKEFDYNTGAGSYYGTYGYDKEGETTWTKLDQHTKLAILGIASAFIPYIGPAISMGIGLADANLYLKEGDTKTAGMVALFASLPGLGGLAGKLGLGKWTSKALAEIGKKISLGSKLSPVEVQVANRVAQYKQVIQSEMAKLGEKVTIGAAKDLAKKQIVKTAVVNTGKNVGKELVKFGTAGAAYSKGYDVVNANDPKVKVSKEGLEWNFVKQTFGSSGTVEENKLLAQAWDSGWRPGQIVPEKFQLNKYKEQYAQEDKNAKELEQLVANLKK